MKNLFINLGYGIHLVAHFSYLLCLSLIYYIGLGALYIDFLSMSSKLETETMFRLKKFWLKNLYFKFKRERVKRKI